MAPEDEVYARITAFRDGQEYARAAPAPLGVHQGLGRGPQHPAGSRSVLSLVHARLLLKPITESLGEPPHPPCSQRHHDLRSRATPWKPSR